MARTGKIDWLAAKKDYISDSTISYSKIANKYGVTKNAVTNRAKKEGWPKLRQDLSDRASTKVEDKIVDDLAEVNIRHGKSYTVAQAVLLDSAQIIHAWVAQLKLEAARTGNPVDPKDLPSLQALKFMSEGLDISIKGERITKGMPINSPMPVVHSGAVVNVNLTPEQWESLIDGTNAANDVIANATAAGRSLPAFAKTTPNS